MRGNRIKPLTGSNYNDWAIDAKAYLRGLGLWGVTSGGALKPMKPYVELTTNIRGTEISVKDDPLKLESTTPEYMQLFYLYRQEYVQYRLGLEKASGAIVGLLDLSLKHKYSEDKWDYDPVGLWNEIKKDQERVLKKDGKQLLHRLNTIRMSEFDNAMKYHTEIKDIVAQLEVCNIKTDDAIVAFHMINGLPNSAEWSHFRRMLDRTGRDMDPESILLDLKVFELNLRRQRGVSDTLSSKNGTRYIEGRETTRVVQEKAFEAQIELPPGHLGGPGNCGTDVSHISTGSCSMPTSGATAAGLMCNQALQMCREATVNELVGDDLPGCEAAYVTSLRLLESMLEKREDGETNLGDDDKKRIGNLLAQIRQRRNAVRKKMDGGRRSSTVHSHR